MQGRFTEKVLVYSSSVSPTKVYKAFDHSLNAFVALKEISLQSSPEVPHRFTEPENQEKLFHPALCRLYDILPEEFSVTLVLEWMDKTLDQEIAARARGNLQFSEGEVIVMLVRMVDALAYAESLGICHRDLKPSNLFMAADGGVKIGDFGSSSIAENGQAMASIVGTPLFLSPLLRKGYSSYLVGETKELKVQHDPFKSDVFSLGLTFLYVLKLSVPDSTRARSQSDIDAEIYSLPVSECLQYVISLMTKISEADRPNFSDLKSIVLSYFFDTYLEFVNYTINQQGRVWNSLTRSHMEGVFQVDVAINARVTATCKCRSCGNEIVLVGGVETQQKAEYCSRVCQNMDEGATAPPLQQVSKPRRFIKIVRRLPEPQADFTRTCLFCLSAEMQVSGIALEDCVKHMVCSLECIQELTDIYGDIGRCISCYKQSDSSRLQAEVQSLRTASEHSFATVLFSSPDLPLAIGQRLEEHHYDLYQRILEFLGTLHSGILSFSLFSQDEMGLLTALVYPLMTKIDKQKYQHLVQSRVSEIMKCKSDKHFISPGFVMRALRGSFRIPFSPELCSLCGGVITIAEQANICNRLDLPEVLCSFCGRTTRCQACTVCGKMGCAGCIGSHH